MDEEEEEEDNDLSLLFLGKLKDGSLT